MISSSSPTLSASGTSSSSESLIHPPHPELLAPKERYLTSVRMNDRDGLMALSEFVYYLQQDVVQSLLMHLLMEKLQLLGMRNLSLMLLLLVMMSPRCLSRW